MPRALAVFLLALLLGVATLGVPAAHSASPDLVVSQVYAGGGNAGAPFANDFVELFNRGSTAVDLSAWTIQYASAAGTTWQATPLAGSVGPGRHYLVQLASGVVGAALPTADATGTTNLAVSGGKVAVVRDATLLACGASAGSCAGVGSVADLVGYGGAADYEGTGAAGSIDNTTAAARALDGCVDTDDNDADFTAQAPTPRNTANAATVCGSQPPPADSASAGATVDVDVQPVLSIALERPAVSFGNATTGSTPAPVSEKVTIASNDTAGYSLTVHRAAFSPADLPLGVSGPRRAGARSAGRSPAGRWRPCRWSPRRTFSSARKGRRARGRATCGTRASGSCRRFPPCPPVITRRPSRSR